MANRKRIESPDKLDKFITEFIDKCRATGMIPSDYELCRFLQISPSTLDAYWRDGEEGSTYHGYSIPLKKLQQFREHRLLDMLEREPKSSTAAIFQLKQIKNGGYTDSPLNAGEGATITLKIQGVGGAEAFK